MIERAILTVKTLLALLPFVPMRREPFLDELRSVVRWYNEHRPHSALRGRTPNEIYVGLHPANRKPRFEPRERWPRGSPCAKPWALARSRPGAQLVMEVAFQAGRKHLPIVTLRRAG